MTILNQPCPECFREEDGKWEYPCPSDDCVLHEPLIREEMLNALKSCEAALAALRKNYRWDAHPEDFNDDVDEAIDAQGQARAAIERATK